ncbi:MAG: ribosome biogenesis GTPase YlqF [Clostridia bacterium]|nr:ribosome biogenesis GTPase YlqF [Clostridia bacterium]
MPPIQWFPGHMTKALREMEKEIKNVDLIFYCLDARAPMSCMNPKLSNLARNKKIIYVLNKADLVEENKLSTFKTKLTTQNSIAVSLNSVESNSTKLLYEKAKKLLSDKTEQFAVKGLNYSIKAMVLGVPNVGKSTLINNFCRKAKTITGNKPGVTKGKQWVSVDEGLVLLDTPGTLWPSFENEKTARNLAYIGSIKDDILDTTDLAFWFIKDIVKIDKKYLEDRYSIQIETNEETLSIFDKICTVRKCLLKQGELDYDRCTKLILDDFRKGRLGKIILD